jgi:hypothetical protein
MGNLVIILTYNKWFIEEPLRSSAWKYRTKKGLASTSISIVNDFNFYEA